MKQIIVTNNNDQKLKNIINKLGKKADKIKIVSAFFSDTKLIKKWLSKSKKIELLVSLRPPTNYYSIKNVYSKLGIKIHFLGDNLHSKFIIFYTNDKVFSCVIGSSNFTSGGLERNIETNAILTGQKYLKAIENEFNFIWKQSFLMQPVDLNNYKIVFDNYQKRQKETDKEQKKLQRKILTKRTTEQKKSNISLEAKQYFSFWRVVDEVKEMVYEISEEEYPGIPVYITIDHFWHWVKTIWSKQQRPKPSIKNRKKDIQKLFKEYCTWDKNQDNYTKKMAEISSDIFAKLLSENHIDNLTMDEALQVYSNLHSTTRTIKQFFADQKFKESNSIEQIRKSLKYLLLSNDDIGFRIHNILKKSEYKLKYLGSSGIQEINGWTKPNEYPIRNDKADDAVKLLGFELGT